jgi:ADP-heptose:LPS heptosyltransferase
VPAPEKKMIDLPVIHFDCKQFAGDRPCQPNKQYGIFCGNCVYYEKDTGITKPFPEIKPGEKAVYDSSHKNILIIKLDAVGDVLRTASVLPSLKNVYPDSDITWITKLKSFPVLEDNKFIDHIYFTDESINYIVSRNFDIAVNLDSGKESCEIMNRVSAEKKFGYTLANGKPYPVNSLANRWYLMGVDDNTKKQNTKTYHEIIHEICGLEYSGSKPELEMTEKKRISAGHINNRLGLHNYAEFILVNLGGGNRWQYKKWTKEGYADLINKLSNIKPNSAIGAVAGDEDREFYSEVMALTDKRDNVFPLGCDNTTEDFIGIVYLADKIFTSDSLAFHIATALNKYAVVITGPTSHTELDVFGNGKILYSAKVDCLVCYLNKCDKTVTCMNTINADEVIDLFL